MKWIGERVSFIDQPKKLTIVINPEDKIWQKGLMSAWFTMWLTIGTLMIWSINALQLNQQGGMEIRMDEGDKILMIKLIYQLMVELNQNFILKKKMIIM